MVLHPYHLLHFDARLITMVIVGYVIGITMQKLQGISILSSNFHICSIPII